MTVTQNFNILSVRGAMPATNGKFSKIFDLTDRVALITGGSVGFGRVISSGLAEYGCHVGVADLNLDNARAVASEVSSNGRRAIGIAVDVSQPEQVKQIRQEEAQRTSPWTLAELEKRSAQKHAGSRGN